MSNFDFPAPIDPASAEALRREVREFLNVELANRTAPQRSESWNGFDAEFSRKLGQKGWIGMTWPKRYGGHERGASERYIVIEELLAAGAPVAAHWIADRQSGPLLLRFGDEEQKSAILPRIARGECFFCIGMSESDAGSDLASLRARATPVDGGYRVNGAKLWTSGAHRADYMILLCRTGGTTEDKHAGVSQLLVDMKTPGIRINPIIDMAGRHHFNEVVFDDVMLPASAMIGKEGDGWRQVTSELAFERSGPERFLSSFTLLVELANRLGADPCERAADAFGRLIAHLVTLRRLSRGIAVMLENGADPRLQAAIVKDLGATFEQEIPEIARTLVDGTPGDPASRDFALVLASTMLDAPTFSLRGGTREILRGIIARGLGLG
jgi:alkylation response protein AidB-like acyl-CoA dehydrogenase